MDSHSSTWPWGNICQLAEVVCGNVSDMSKHCINKRETGKWTVSTKERQVNGRSNILFIFQNVGKE